MRTTGAIGEWIRYFCAALGTQASHAVERIHAFLRLRDATLADLRVRRMSGSSIAVAERLIEYPLISVKHVAATHGARSQTANTAAALLVEAGALTETTGRNYRREFQAAALMEILFGQLPRN